MCLLACNLVAPAIGNSSTVLAIHVGYQIAMVGVSFFLLIAASITSFKIHALWMLQGLVGMVLLPFAWNLWIFPGADFAYRLWIALNLTLCGRAFRVSRFQRLLRTYLSKLASVWMQPVRFGNLLRVHARCRPRAHRHYPGSVFLCFFPTPDLAIDHQSGRTSRTGCRA